MGTKILCELNDNEVISIEKSRKGTRYSVPAYDCIGGNMDYNTKEQGFENLYSILEQLSKTATWFWWRLVQERNRRTNIATYKAKSAKESVKISAAYSELYEKGLIVRVRQQQYLINPKAFIPEFSKYVEVQEHWDSLIKGDM